MGPLWQTGRCVRQQQESASHYKSAEKCHACDVQLRVVGIFLFHWAGSMLVKARIQSLLRMSGSSRQRCCSSVVTDVRCCSVLIRHVLLQMFGSSGYLNRPTGGTLESYVQCFPVHHKENHHIKTIANLDYADRADRDPHHFLFRVHSPLSLQLCHMHEGMHCFAAANDC